ncbi:hypothetical protein HanXRQr2_Chr14g0665921 [Helianthus annuus]|uniref:Uncharacterized protein n=1 Tax=Helianthus annuus TaxID=4232 RepID=A0A251SM93_HELAN|nr:hypothetical protein HanXRQr2_Chr14g0665921 [Helianthus annuus]KAJ0465886.1 hypothetical protein HanHA300_Chr14g0543051 [Helianthus annuus]KAJ0487463.1 hypothetical protein HanHA89_Chr14g0590651 [Helianthus annuus]KAJ0657904.1 hypothetical protein HanLR1_Chr14g0551831 [Helianthus annuus]KAJ0661587.1 hypothetical protein HanOQP8_Chr14g0550131 [Helianthus annuus]
MFHVLHCIIFLHNHLKYVSVTEVALCETVETFVNALLLAKPAGLKKSKQLSLSATLNNNFMKLGMSKNPSPVGKPEIVGTVLGYGISFINVCWFGMGIDNFHCWLKL